MEKKAKEMLENKKKKPDFLEKELIETYENYETNFKETLERVFNLGQATVFFMVITMIQEDWDIKDIRKFIDQTLSQEPKMAEDVYSMLGERNKKNERLYK